MADPHAATAPAITAANVPVTEEAFLEDRVRFWEWFGGLIKTSIVAIVILLIALTVFLV
jgi:hypothetical protein